jgi:hypothetical protein
MKMNQIHIDLVRNVLTDMGSDRLLSHKNFTIADTGNDDRDGEVFLDKYMAYRETDPNFDSIIGAYFIASSFFYYIEKINTWYVLTRRVNFFERKTILKEDEYASLVNNEDTVSHMTIIGICYLVDYHKFRLGL